MALRIIDSPKQEKPRYGTATSIGAPRPLSTEDIAPRTSAFFRTQAELAQKKDPRAALLSLLGPAPVALDALNALFAPLSVAGSKFGKAVSGEPQIPLTSEIRAALTGYPEDTGEERVFRVIGETAGINLGIKALGTAGRAARALVAADDARVIRPRLPAPESILMAKNPVTGVFTRPPRAFRILFDESGQAQAFRPGSLARYQGKLFQVESIDKTAKTASLIRAGESIIAPLKDVKAVQEPKGPRPEPGSQIRAPEAIGMQIRALRKGIKTGRLEQKREAFKKISELRKELSQRIPQEQFLKRSLSAQGKAFTAGEKRGALEAEQPLALKSLARQGKAFQIGEKLGRLTEREKNLSIEDQRKVRQEISGKISRLRSLNVSQIRTEFAEPIRQITKDLTLKSFGKRTLTKVNALTDALMKEPNMQLSDESLNLLNEAGKTPMRLLSTDQIRAVHDSVIHMVKLDQLKKTLLSRGKRRELENVAKESTNELVRAKQPEKLRAISKEGESAFKKLKQVFGIRQEHPDLIIETISGGNNSVTYEVLFRNVMDGVRNQLATEQSIRAHWDELIDLPSWMRRNNIRNIQKWRRGVVKKEGVEMTHAQRTSFWALMQNENAARHITKGGMVLQGAPNTVIKLSEDKAAKLIQSMDAAEIELGRASLQLGDYIGKDILAPTFNERTGLEFPREENYFRIDVNRTALPQDPSDITLESLQEKQLGISIRKQFLNQRKKSELPINVNDVFHELNISIADASRYIGLDIPLSDASRLLNNPDFRSSLQARWGNEAYTELFSYLRDTASPSLFSQFSPTGKLLVKFKGNVTSGILGINPFVAAKQAISLAYYSLEVPEMYLMEAATALVSPSDFKNAVARHKSNSPFFKARLEKGFQRDLAEISETISNQMFSQLGKRPLKQRVTFLVNAFDTYAVTVGTEAVLLWQREILRNQGLNADQILDLAYKKAEEITSQTQPEFHPIFRSGFSRGGELENIASSFSAATNSMQQIIKRYWRRARKENTKEAWQQFAKALSIVVLFASQSVEFINATRDWLVGREKPFRPSRFVTAPPRQMASLWFILRDIYSTVEYSAQTGRFSMAGTPTTDALNDVLAAAVELIEVFTAKEGKRKKQAIRAADKIVEVILLSRGLPWHTPKQLAESVVRNVKPKEKKGKIKGARVIKSRKIPKRSLRTFRVIR